MEVLLVLARAEGGAVSRDRLIETCWTGRAVSDDAVARIIAKLRAVTRAFEPSPWTVETLPKLGFRLLPTIPESAAFSAEIVQQPPGSEAGPTRAPATRRRWRSWALLGLFIGLATGIAIWWDAERGERPGPGALARVRVEPFAPSRQDASLLRLSTAVDAALLRELRRGELETANGDGRGAEFRIVGTVDQAGGEHVVQARVTDTRGEVLWAARYARPSSRLAGFEEETANRVADAMHCALSGRASEPRPVSGAALALLLEGCAVRRGADAAEVAEYVEITRRLVALAPELSVAHSQRAVALAVVALRKAQTGSAPDAGDRAAVAAAADRALFLNPRNGEAHFAIGISQGSGARWREREASFDRAAELSPDLSVVRNYRVFMLGEVGRLEEADAPNARTVASDRFSPTQLSLFAESRAAAGDLETSRRMLARLALIAPEHAAETRTRIAFWGRDPVAALSALRAAPAGTSWSVDRACLEAYLLRLARAQGVQLRGLPAACAVNGPYRMRMLARQGDLDAAYAVMPQAERFNTAIFFGPEMERFRADRRFMPLAYRLGLLEYWKSSGVWPDFCRAPDEPYDCHAEAQLATRSRRAPEMTSP